MMVYVECKPDEALIRNVTGLSRREIVHERKGKGEVCNRLRAGENSKGVVDEDPGSLQPRYLRSMVVARELPEQGLLLLADMARDNRLVVLRRRLEEWILAAANEAGLDVRAYGLPRTPRQLHGAINTNLDKFERLLQVLGARPSPRLKTLGELLS